jgi:hypothetical protein
VGPWAGFEECEEFHPTGIRSPAGLARSQSLYRLRCCNNNNNNNNNYYYYYYYYYNDMAHAPCVMQK